MAYKMYIDGVLMPITPSKVKVKINNQNRTLTLINGEEINILKEAALTDVSFDLSLPQTNHSYNNPGWQMPSVYLGLFERLKVGKKPFQWILNRSRPNGAALFYSNLTVGLEDYQITDDAGEGFDVGVTVKLKQYRAFGTKTVTITPPSASAPAQPATATVAPPPRETASAPTTTSYSVVKGDCLWNIAKKYLGDGSRYTEIYEANKATIDKHGGGPNMIWPGDKLIIPAK